MPSAGTSKPYTVLYLEHVIHKIPHRGFNICLDWFCHSTNISWKPTECQAQFLVLEYNTNREKKRTCFPEHAFLRVCGREDSKAIVKHVYVYYVMVSLVKENQLRWEENYILSGLFLQPLRWGDMETKAWRCRIQGNPGESIPGRGNSKCTVSPLEERCII